MGVTSGFLMSQTTKLIRFQSSSSSTDNNPTDSKMWWALASSMAAVAFGVPSATGAEFVSKTFFLKDGDIIIISLILAVPLSSLLSS